MTIEEFDSIISNALKDVPISDIYDEDFDDTPAKISRKTDRYVKKLAKEMFCSPSKPEKKQRVRLRYLVAAIIGASVLTVGVGAYCSKFVFDKGDAEMDYVAVESTVSDKTSIEEVYELTYNLDGYKLTSYSERESGVSACYEKGTHFIKLSQRIVGSDDMLVNTENAIIETIDINGEEAIYIDSTDEYGDSQLLIWTYDGYEFYLRANAAPNNRDFEKEQMVQIAQTIQIKDN